MLKIALDIDDTIVSFYEPYKKLFNKKNDMNSHIITRNVYSLRKNKDFWSNLPLLERPDFEPFIYCTKRINSKTYTKNCLRKHNLPIKPIYQIYSQKRNKADYIRHICDVLIDDSYYNVMQCINSGFPALLITRDHNIKYDTPYRINNLKYNEILKKYNELFR